MRTFWLSFAADEGRGGRVVLVDAESSREAADASFRWVQAGDETLILEIPPEMPEFRLPRNRVLTEAEIAGVGAMQLGEAREQGLVPDHDRVCAYRVSGGNCTCRPMPEGKR